MILKPIFLLFLLSVAQIASGQFYEVTRYADDSGLPSRMVRDVVQDEQGFLWVAGYNGLFKFDGQKFRGYYSVLKDTTGLRDNKINTVLSGSDNRIWIATPKGLHVLENDLIRYVHLPNPYGLKPEHVTALFEDSNKTIWVGTYFGLYAMPHGTNLIKHIADISPYEKDGVVVWGLTEDMKGNIWINRGQKLPTVIANKDTFGTRELSITYQDGIVAQEITLYKSVTLDDGVVLVNSDIGLLKGEFIADSIFKVSRFRDENGDFTATDYTYNLIVDIESFIWTATRSEKFNKYRYQNGILRQQEVHAATSFSEMNLTARSVFQDAQKNIWVTNNNGLFKLSRSNDQISVFPPKHIADCWEETFNVYGITEDNRGYLWITTPYTLYRFKKEDVLSNNCPEDFLEIKSSHTYLVRDILVDSSDRLWLSGRNGISIAQLDTNYEPGDFFQYTKANGLPHNWSYDIQEFDKNTFWAANYIRLLKIDLPNGNFREAQFTPYNSSTERTDALVNSYTMELEKDEAGDLWVGTFSGVSRLISSEEEGAFENYESAFGKPKSLSNNAIKKIFRDKKDRLWIGTQTGLNLYNKETNNFLQLGRMEGLPSEYILGIQDDSDGNLWVGTTGGVFKGVYNESMESFVHIQYFTKREGLADNITNVRTLYVDANDNVFVGSAKGLSLISNSDVGIKARDFNLGLTALEHIDREKKQFVSINQLVYGEEIMLSHEQNSIQLDYSVLDFTNPDYNRYRHKFLPDRDEWIDTGTDSELKYHNLSPGSYQLVLDGSNSQGIWAKDPITISLTIQPPFWKSNWAIAFYVLLIFGLLRLSYLMRIKKRVRELEQETKLEKALVREREQLRNENAADFHDELGSKVTKVSMFLTLAERSLEEGTDPSNWFGKIRENVRDLSGGFRDLLWVIDPGKDSLSDTFLRLKDFGEDLFANMDTHFSTSGYSEEMHTIILDAQIKKQVVLIFKEAMHNCAKYAESSLVELYIESTNGDSSIVLKDDGNGFNVATQSKGRGLSNMKDRANKINTQFILESNESGTSVTLNGIPHLRD